MFLFFAVIAGALVIAVVIGGDVRRLAQLRVRHVELLIAALAAKVSVALLGTSHSQAALNAARPLNVIGAVLLLGVAIFNRRIPGAIVFGLGLLSNLAAILWFGGRMPVLLPAGFEPTPGGALPALRQGLDPLHVLLPHPQGLWFLGDIVQIPGILGRTSLVSIGDLLMAGGIAYLIIRWSHRPRPAVTVPTPSPAK
ncbi:MAG TPA: DUF5317 family protein [Candidatus Dormibacteraeota bacterium]